MPIGISLKSCALCVATLHLHSSQVAGRALNQPEHGRDSEPDHGEREGATAAGKHRAWTLLPDWLLQPNRHFAQCAMVRSSAATILSTVTTRKPSRAAAAGSSGTSGVVTRS